MQAVWCKRDLTVEAHWALAAAARKRRAQRGLGARDGWPPHGDRVLAEPMLAPSASRRRLRRAMGEDAQEIGSADEDLRDLRPALRLAKKVGKALGRRASLFGTLSPGEALRYCSERGGRRRIGPFRADGSMTTPLCVISRAPRRAIATATRRTAGVNARQPASSGVIARATSEGQMVFPAPRARHSRRISAAIVSSVGAMEGPLGDQVG